ncbi:hypothetical protein TREMEDRAFT_33512 [Tremella mesenterica DSM 1558]|uniref:uncharacterized protein n=1 Tax=Tremella mesenterica (strain ATCC 24925 / CBS 8224 / DSM 1558 / NBRC 9311 / NRRL Y-6157 / RJB 2259-6 / UBC 559-6) TaxID=578456 RepID=UPI0003F49E99|nr:uncharacterized protein TREMEDRAFT_33512 [Tremella mesenterica DSM 1558]EIW67497.1 hypothetical protein TREMEDRAFT_33512 [Tremella mesenterica DSM 1558]
MTYDTCSQCTRPNAQLVQSIHLLSLNPFLPQVSKRIYSTLHNSSPTTIATYLLSLYAHYGPEDVLVRSVRHPVCDVGVCREIRRLWDMRRGDFSVEEVEKTQDGVKIGPLSCVELPRRLFRPPFLLPTSSFKPPRASQTTVFSSNQHTQDPLSVDETFSANSTLHPLLIHLFSTYSPSPNSHKGYPLCRAVLARDVSLIQFLLYHGADPSVKGWMALELAIHMKDLELVRLLVDRNWVERQTSKGVEEEVNGRCKKRRRISITIDPKFVDLAMKKGAHDVVEYFVKEKGESS